MLSELCLLKTAAPKEVTGDLVSIAVTSAGLKDQENRKFFLMEKNADRPELVQKNNYVSGYILVVLVKDISFHPLNFEPSFDSLKWVLYLSVFLLFKLPQPSNIG